MNIDVDKIVVSLDVVAPDAVVVEASAVAPSGIVTEAVAELPTQVIVISHEETPTVTPLQIIDFGSSSIECAFDVATEQAEEVVKGVLCGTINPPTFENADYRLLHGQGSMDLAFAGLQNNTEYYLRPYALSNLGYKYGDVIVQRTKASPIPEEYQLVEWIKSFGGQYFVLDTMGGLDTYDFEIQLISMVETNKFYILGNFNQPGQAGLMNGYTTSTQDKIIFTYYVNNVNYDMVVADCDSLSTIQKVNGNIYTNGTHVASIPDNTRKLTNSRTALLGASEGQNFPCVVELFYCKLLLDGEDVVSLYPVYRKSDSKPGMYDIVNNAFYTNQGSGEFTVGPDKEWEE